MGAKLRGLAVAGMAALGMGAGAPAHALGVEILPPTFSEFGFSESPGRYTITNNSTDAYIYRFSVTNPLAQYGDAWNSQPATPPNSAWWDCGGNCDDGSFVYWNPGGQTDLTYDIAPGATASDFYFDVALASQVTFDVVQNGNSYAVSANGTSLLIPEASSWVMMFGGFSLLAWCGYSRRELLRQQA